MEHIKLELRSYNIDHLIKKTDWLISREIPEDIVIKPYKPLTEELIDKVISELREQNEKDLKEQTVYFYHGGWKKCSGKTYKQMFK